ncbi:hypothetical protein [Larkinella soli]|uniref:hypothetical protein n=1 Tax=Larkinella soli TaxID=1770527 RepID=UPI0013E3B4F2|nr:hypothetical protein [Larkinella soli]
MRTTLLICLLCLLATLTCLSLGGIALKVYATALAVSIAWIIYELLMAEKK